MKVHKFWLRSSKTDKNIPDGMIVGPFSNVVGSFITTEKISVFGRISNSIIKCDHLIIHDGGYVSGVVNSDHLEILDGGTLDAECYISPERTITPVINGISINVIIQNSVNKNNLISSPPKLVIK